MLVLSTLCSGDLLALFFTPTDLHILPSAILDIGRRFGPRFIPNEAVVSKRNLAENLSIQRLPRNLVESRSIV